MIWLLFEKLTDIFLSISMGFFKSHRLIAGFFVFLLFIASLFAALYFL